MSPADAALMARHSDIASCSEIRMEGEGFDNPDCPCRGARMR
jgi:hypothetical protein